MASFLRSNFLYTVLYAAFILCSFYPLSSTSQVRKEYLLDNNWKFIKGEVKNGEAPGFNDKGWETVSVPHDWAIKGPFNGNNDIQNVQIVQNGEAGKSLKSGRTGGLPFVGVGWYRKQLSASYFKPGQHAVLLFDGAMSYPKVFVNGKEAGHWAYGYNSFSIDITSFIKPGDLNTLAVRLENLPEASRWYPGAGLYRNVYLIVTDDIHIPVWGTYITTPVINSAFAKVLIKTKIDGSGTASSPLRLSTEIRDATGKTLSSVNSVLTATDGNQFEQQLVVNTPVLWSPETPVLYTAVSKLYEGDQLKDEYKTSFGIRTIKFESGKGFSLNGTYRKFKGVCNHHDLGPLGAAINTAALKRQLTLLKDMGCDAIRTSHNMPAPELVKLCDEMGFMLMVESFDEWKSPKVKNGYSHLFDEWAEKDIVNMVHRDRNNPSVIMWSIGNEVPDQGAVNGNKLVTFLQDICHREDPTRPVTMGMDRIDNALNNNFASAVDIPGFNYKPARYEEANTRLPQGFILGTETASTVSSRGVYKFPVQFLKNKVYDDNQSSSYDFESCTWSQIPDDEFVKQDDMQYVLGEFVWTGFDYLGEPTPYDEKWPSHSSYFGILDLAGMPKDRYYLYRSRWNTEKQTLHILPHWTFPGREGLVTPVFVYTSYPSAELFVNGKSMGRQTKSNTSSTTRYRLMWNEVKYEPGSLKVVAYDQSGKAVAEEFVHTAGKPDHLVLEADKNNLAADGKDLSYVTVKVVDKEGNLCPDASNELMFKVAGAGKFKVTANGDASSLELFHLPHMKAFKGMLVATVQSGSAPGKITLNVSSKGLKTGILILDVE
ncbi:beta-galactosidase [Pedobacter westerhofensis]|uniref:Beta-galactosidase n=1 Tax=Pedobacter westerhofensis TaxID=425512 RepID=A0A521FVQ8_9SPHI|nr:beta-galactosidase GalB [Pedobacter westerhofensis]SMO99740.1 beta-galactosidase [Pedobacter westerhofensis]